MYDMLELCILCVDMHISSRAVKSDTPSETSATAMSTAPDHEPAELAPKVGLLRSRIVGDQVGTKFWHLKRIYIYIFIYRIPKL